ncbi:helix-turn-helix domain-containing protein [Microbacterium sp. CFBP 13617]|uniref:helix-turn-helix domain-containing protein n=1 Tax=Microbacterium sp. CFBP 13617 TaxID=2774035 RepID=UPI00177D97D1|nr:helix-turn-helix domain-containing protein [Microbacterium sp. CFBP 13617]MBD8218103.1 helix-turn-helix domain-containing protein [Microbacterium sp. CFBP 13617]
MTDDASRKGGRPPVDEATRARIVELARAGMSRKAIHRETGVGATTVSRVCRDAQPPVSFERKQTAAAVAARSYDAKAERARLSQRMLAEANAALDRLHAPHVVVGWYRGDSFEHELAHPTSGDVKNYMLAAAVAVDKHIALERHDGSDLELSAVDQFILYVSRGILA